MATKEEMRSWTREQWDQWCGEALDGVQAARVGFHVDLQGAEGKWFGERHVQTWAEVCTLIEGALRAQPLDSLGARQLIIELEEGTPPVPPTA